ncbi:type II toxin-antitoxin system PemK/MazF family toxin [Alicyclobacillus macrosporangiidus]|uniref:type II toxin-antitoxin system PemK/MazF family toxin n=1 Tax=Alicyclobacillus macrosporangiidus TaxID=392015 RepID=UPI0015872A4C
MRIDERRKRQVEHDRANADQGDFFFAFLADENGKPIPHPVFVLGKHNDSNDNTDVIICKCTKQEHGSRGAYDIPVKLRYDSFVRTNKIYTISRNQLDFKIKTPYVDENQKRAIVDQAINAIFHKEMESTGP